MINNKQDMKETIEYLNSLKIRQTSLDVEQDNIPVDAYEKYFANSTCVASELDIDDCRWYETGITVWETPQGLFGMRVITNIDSEQSEVEDLGWIVPFFEMEEFTTVSYKQKK